MEAVLARRKPLDLIADAAGVGVDLFKGDHTCASRRRLRPAAARLALGAHGADGLDGVGAARQLDGAAGDAGAGVARGLGGLAVHRRRARLVVVARAEVVGVRVHHHGAADDRGRPLELDQLVHDLALGHAAGVRLDVAEVADMAFLVLGRAVRLAEWVVVRAGRGAAIAEVGLLMDVEAMLAGREALDLVGDLTSRRVHLLEADHTGAAGGGLCAAAAGLALGAHLAHGRDGVGHPCRRYCRCRCCCC
mmetsp:Transcript_9737/g.30987  ORF Transcript_9737/g.30987 Transcript_9737/m.30987 type:complete len:249 (-) Transcript_9737:15-761(-)